MPKSTTHRWLAILGWTALGLVLAIYIGLPAAMGIAAVWPSRASVGEPPAGFEAVTLERADGVEIAAWYAPPRNGAAIVVAHGAGGSRQGVRRQAEMFAERGYGVLAIDMSGHGESGGRANRLAWQGSEDISAAARYLADESGVRRIGAFGSSMGGEAVLGASAAVPQLEAIVADGATRRSTAELTTLPSKRSLVESFVPRVMYATVQALAWQRPPAPLLEEMRKAAATRYLLIGAGGNPLETEFNRYFAEQIGSRAELWIAPGVGHVGALSRYPEEYERRVMEFYDEALLR
ncbi:MAG: alpha/beta fold hydrolase [Coriobacteriia bacterium]|nr:alpha/beta fold hydrolase [Coriobacteriia bacterium]